MGSEGVADFPEIKGGIPNGAQVTVPERAVNPLRGFLKHCLALLTPLLPSTDIVPFEGVGLGVLGFSKVSRVS